MAGRAPSLANSGVQAGPAGSDERRAFAGPVTIAAARPTVFVSINGVLQPTLRSAQWRAGRDGWFSDLVPSTASLSFTDAVTGAIGDDILIMTETGLRWRGRVETIRNDKQLGTGDYAGSVTAVDRLAALGISEYTGVLGSASGYTLATLIPFVMNLIGMDPVTIVEGDSATALPALVNTTAIRGRTMLEYIQLAERSSNALMTLQPDGSLLAVTRDAIAEPGVGINGDFETDTAGWTGINGGSIARSTTTPIAGVADGQITCTTTQYSGAYYPITGTFKAGRTYRLTMTAQSVSGEDHWYFQLFSPDQYTHDGYGPLDTFTATGTAETLTFDWSPTIDVSDVRIEIGASDATPVAGVLAIDDVTVTSVVDILDLVGDNAPRSWVVEELKSSVINRWLFTDAGDTVRLDTSDADSIEEHGENSFVIADYMDDDADHWSSAMRTALASPRPTVTRGEFPIKSTDQAVLGLKPLDWVRFDGDTWQVMSVEHTVTPSEWTMAITADVSQNWMAGAADPDTVDPDPSPPTLDTQTATSTKSATAFLSSGGAKYGNGAGNFLPVGFYQNTRTRAFIGFPTITKPTGFIRVRRATLNLRTSGQDWVAFGGKPKLYARRITESWTEGTFDAAAPNQYSASNALVWPGPSTTKVGQVLKSMGAGEDTERDIDVTEIVEAAFRAGTFHGIALISANEDSKVNTIELCSDDHGTSAARPSLTVICEVS